MPCRAVPSRCKNATFCRFFVVANAVACAYSLLVLLVPPASPASRLVLMADVVSNTTVLSLKQTHLQG